MFDFRVLTPDPNQVFSGNYAENATKDLNEDIVDEDAIAEHYDYNSDSDLEDEEDLESTKKPPPLLRGHPFDPFCFIPEEDDGSEASNDADNKPQDTIWYFRVLHLLIFLYLSKAKQ